MEYRVKHIPEKNRFEYCFNGLVAYSEYRICNGCVDIIRTSVPLAAEGRGIADELIKRISSFAAENGYSLKATCRYAAKWLKRHPVCLPEPM